VNGPVCERAIESAAVAEKVAPVKPSALSELGTVTVNPFEIAAVAHVDVETVTVRAPVAAAPVIVTVHVTLVEVADVIDAVTPVPEKVTAVAPARFVPVRTTPVSVWPWAPDDGEMPVIVAKQPGVVTTSVTLVVCVLPPPVPVIVSG
jgi:hypothetical protein